MSELVPWGNSRPHTQKEGDAVTVYCYDTEFLEDGRTVELISIGIVCDDGREYYAVNADMDEDRIKNDRWMLNNVWIHLPLKGFKRKPATVSGKIEQIIDSPGWLDTKDSRVKPKWVIANEVRDFLLYHTIIDDNGITDAPELWAYFAAYDHVVLAQLWGKMIGLPKGIPMYTHDIKQEMDRLGVPSDAVPKPSNQHDALADARWNVDMLHKLEVSS
jgi:hypothetical protein